MLLYAEEMDQKSKKRSQPLKRWEGQTLIGTPQKSRLILPARAYQAVARLSILSGEKSKFYRINNSKKGAKKQDDARIWRMFLV